MSAGVWGQSLKEDELVKAVRGEPANRALSTTIPLTPDYYVPHEYFFISLAVLFV